jgi:hypothetical protein
MTSPSGFQNEYLQMQGAFYLGDRDAQGNAQNWRFIGNVNPASLQAQMESSDHIESYTGKRNKDLKLFGQRTATISLTLENLEAKNLAMAQLGKLTTDASATVVTNEPIPVVTGGENYLLLKNANITTFTKLAATSGGAALPAAHYSVDLKYGIIRILNNASFPPGASVFADYTAGVKTRVTGLSEAVQYRWLRFNGINTLNNKSIVLHAPKVVLIPDSELELLTDESSVASLAVNLDILYDGLQADQSQSYYYYDYF